MKRRKIFSEVDFFFFLRVINFLKPSWNTQKNLLLLLGGCVCVKLLFFFMGGGHFGDLLLRIWTRRVFPPFWKKKTSWRIARIQLVCVQGGLAGLKGNKPFFFLYFLYTSFYIYRGPGVRGHFSQEPSRGKRVFFLYFNHHPKRVTRWSEKREKKKRKMAPHSSLTATYHAIYKKKVFLLLFGATTFTSSSSSLFPQK